MSPHRSFKQFRRSSPPSLHWVPRVGSPASSVLRGDRTPRRPSRRASFPSLGDTAAIQRSETTRSPRFLEDPRTRALLFDPGGTGVPGHRGSSPTLRHVDVAFRTEQRRRLPRIKPFGAHSHGPHAHCLRFAARVAPGPRKTRFPAGDLPWPVGIRTRWVPSKGFGSAIHQRSPFPGFPGALPESSTVVESAGTGGVVVEHPKEEEDRRARGTSLPFVAFRISWILLRCAVEHGACLALPGHQAPVATPNLRALRATARDRPAVPPLVLTRLVDTPPSGRPLRSPGRPPPPRV